MVGRRHDAPTWPDSTDPALVGRKIRPAGSDAGRAACRCRSCSAVPATAFDAALPALPLGPRPGAAPDAANPQAVDPDPVGTDDGGRGARGPRGVRAAGPPDADARGLRCVFGPATLVFAVRACAVPAPWTARGGRGRRRPVRRDARQLPVRAAGPGAAPDRGLLGVGVHRTGRWRTGVARPGPGPDPDSGRACNGWCRRPVVRGLHPRPARRRSPYRHRRRSRHRRRRRPGDGRVDHFLVAGRRVTAELARKDTDGGPAGRAGEAPELLPVPAELAAAPVLDDAAARAVAALAARWRQFFGGPQDVEGASPPRRRRASGPGPAHGLTGRPPLYWCQPQHHRELPGDIRRAHLLAGAGVSTGGRSATCTAGWACRPASGSTPTGTIWNSWSPSWTAGSTTGWTAWHALARPDAGVRTGARLWEEAWASPVEAGPPVTRPRWSRARSWLALPGTACCAPPATPRRAAASCAGGTV